MKPGMKKMRSPGTLEPGDCHKCNVMMPVPVRMCIYCRGRFPKAAMRRFVKKNGMIIRDKKGTFSGRGAYCCSDAGCVRQAESDRRGLLERALNSS